MKSFSDSMGGSSTSIMLLWFWHHWGEKPHVPGQWNWWLGCAIFTFILAMILDALSAEKTPSK